MFTYIVDTCRYQLKEHHSICIYVLIALKSIRIYYALYTIKLTYKSKYVTRYVDFSSTHKGN